MKYLIAFVILISVLACKEKAKETSIEIIKSEDIQRIYFDGLMSVTNQTIPQLTRQDSLAFLVLPLEASCPSCRKKTIDSILKHKSDLRDKHYIVLSINGSIKTINGYFEDRKGQLPQIRNKLFLDSVNNAFFLKLYDMKPTMYYTYQGKAYKKVAAIPTTVKEDLREFFSGSRNKHHHSKS